jgi:hypothetical protein
MPQQFMVALDEGKSSEVWPLPHSDQIRWWRCGLDAKTVSRCSTRNFLENSQPPRTPPAINLLGCTS